MRFKKEIIKLTAIFVSIVMLVSIIFSFVIHQISTNEINLALGRQGRILRNMPSDVSNVSILDIESLRQTQLAESNGRLVTNLIIFNLLILFASSGLGYFWARKTIEPIEEAFTSQRRFTSDASHELRTPLTAMKAEIEVGLRDKSLNLVAAKEILNSNLEEIKRLEDMSNSLLVLASIEENNVEKNLVKLDKVMEKVFASYIKIADKKKITLSKDMGTLAISYNPTGLEQLFGNLVGNAIKYGNEGGYVKVIGRSQPKHIVVEVEDNGIGISKENREHIFDRFYRTDESRTNSMSEGFGLGLSIAKMIVEDAGGSISVRSEIDKGTKFSVIFPNG